MSINLRGLILMIRKQAFSLKTPIKRNNKTMYIVFDWLSCIGIGSGIITFFAGIFGVGWWLWPFSIGFGIVALLLLYYRLFPMKWSEMSDREKVIYVSYNGINKLTTDQLQEFQKIYNEYSKTQNKTKRS